MDILESKVQFKNYEQGEFSEIQRRTVLETIELIKSFPWQEQRGSVDIGLTGPSITIEHPSGRFLKIGTYFNGKYCLYFLSEKSKLRNKIVEDLSDCFEVVIDFFKNIDLFTSFEKAPPYSNARKHFVTNSFEFCVTPSRILEFLWDPTIFITLLLLLFLTLGFTQWEVFAKLAGLSVIVGLLAILNGPNIYLFINYYFYSKDLYLKLSKGHSKFYFGIKGSYKEYLKEDIEFIHIFHHQGIRNPWNENTIFQIILKNGEEIKFPNLLIKTRKFTDKMHNCRIEWKHRFIASISTAKAP